MCTDNFKRMSSIKKHETLHTNMKALKCLPSTEDVCDTFGIDCISATLVATEMVLTCLGPSLGSSRIALLAWRQ